MAVQINWGLAQQQPDFVGNALKAYQGGQQMVAKDATRNALAQYKTDPEGSINALMSVDPVAASQLRQLHVQDRADQRTQAASGLLQKGDIAGAYDAAAGDATVTKFIDGRVEHMRSLNAEQAAGLQAVSTIADPAERARVWDSTVAPRLTALGLSPDKVSSKVIDLSTPGIDAAVRQTLSAKELLDLDKPSTVAPGGALVTRAGKEIYKAAPKEENPSGYSRNPDNSLSFIKGGPADPEVIKKTAIDKRQIIVSMPTQGQGEGGKAPAGYRFKPDGSLDFITGGPADPAVRLKPVPSKIQQGLSDNRTALTQIDQAIAAIEANPHALGLQNMVGDRIMQRIDEGGVGVRAQVANIGSKIIHDRSGAAVTAAEAPRLKPFIPDATDSPKAAVIKLKKLRQQVENDTSSIELAYGEDSGYRPLSGGGSSPARTAPAKAGDRPSLDQLIPRTK